MIVTDIIREKTPGVYTKGYYMDGYLKENLDPIPNFLAKEWDVVGIISGHGKVGVGKSTLAMQVGYYIAWLIAGGRVHSERVEVNGKQKHIIREIVKPDKKINFSMANIVFSAEDLVKKAEKLPKNSVIIYDEGRSGLDSASAMTSINKGMAEFFQRCRVYHHVILIVLPNFFKLHEDYAIARSLFLIDTFADENFNRGHFNLFGEKQKEKLYYFGKKRIGVTAKYNAAYKDAYGKFTKWMPIPKEEYEEAKKKAMENQTQGSRITRMRKMRDASIYLLNSHSELGVDHIATTLMALTGEKINKHTIENILIGFNKKEKE